MCASNILYVARADAAEKKARKAYTHEMSDEEDRRKRIKELLEGDVENDGVRIRRDRERAYAWMLFLVAATIFLLSGLFCLMTWGAASEMEYQYAVERLAVTNYLFAGLGLRARP